MSSELAFSYNYSAAQSREAQMIRDKYLPKEESALDELKRLDRAVGMILAYPVYRCSTNKAKEKYQPRILELAAQLCGEQ